MGSRTHRARTSPANKRRTRGQGLRTPSGKKHSRPRTSSAGGVERSVFGYSLLAVSAAAAVMLVTALDFWIAWLIGVNVVVLIALSFDRTAAVRHRERVPDLAFQVLAACGGSPMTWVARPLFEREAFPADFTRTLAVITGVQVLVGGGLVYYLNS